jgi:alkanesulfonate monooxygenase SsuD/methylene tetrahydromethanopterin reductase-like flavin-dependent oxidoreductase (luciferase family)
MDVGIGLPTTIPGVERDQVLEWARRAEARGFSSLGTIDRLVYDNYEPLIALAAAGAVTERIKLATTILIAPFRANGALLAKQAASVDRLSNGRLVLGVAVGGREDDYSASDVDFHQRGRMFDGMLEQWQSIWSGDSFGTAGAIGPRPARERPTLIIGGSADVTFQRIARYGDGWVMGGGTPDQFSQGADQVRAAWQAAGREGRPRLMALSYYALGDQAEAAANRYLRDYYAFLGDYAGMVADSAATDADTVRGYVQGFTAAGCDELVLFPSDPDPAQVDLLADALA